MLRLAGCVLPVAVDRADHAVCRAAQRHAGDDARADQRAKVAAVGAVVLGRLGGKVGQIDRMDQRGNSAELGDGDFHGLLPGQLGGLLRA